MQMIASPRRPRLPIAAVLLGTLVGLALFGGGLFLGWLALGTPLVTALAPATIRPSPSQMVLGGFVWGVALVAPASFTLVGAWRLSRVVRAITIKPAVRVLTQASAYLGDEYVAASDVRLPEGRLIGNLVLGPFGLAVLTELPSRRVLRRTGASWETRGPDGRWIHMENPVERASRDAERVRAWFSSADRDYVLKVFAALVTTDPTVARTPTCAVVAPEQVPGWLGSLPPSRALNGDRRAQIVEQITALL